jgi:hypothetical protein
VPSIAQSVQQGVAVAADAALPVGKELIRRLISAVVPMGVDAGIGMLDPTQGISRANFTVDPLGSNAHEAPFKAFQAELQRPVVSISDLPEQLERKKKRDEEPRRETFGAPGETRPSFPLMRDLGPAPTRQPLMKF